jgi:hypothetical protein
MEEKELKVKEMIKMKKKRIVVFNHAAGNSDCIASNGRWTVN